VQVSPDIADIYAGGERTCVLYKNGEANCWGT
jgi:hypothetical protein